MTHDELVQRAERWLRNTRRCSVVLTERYISGETIEIADAIGWNSRGQSIVVECKVSRGDFRADLEKPCRRRPSGFCLGMFRYYLTPPGLLLVGDVPAAWGLLEVGSRQMRVIRKASLQEWNALGELRLLVSEVARYQIHGITYPPLTLVDRSKSAEGGISA